MSIPNNAPYANDFCRQVLQFAAEAAQDGKAMEFRYGKGATHPFKITNLRCTTTHETDAYTSSRVEFDVVDWLQRFVRRENTKYYPSQQGSIKAFGRGILEINSGAYFEAVDKSLWEKTLDIFHTNIASKFN